MLSSVHRIAGFMGWGPSSSAASAASLWLHNERREILVVARFGPEGVEREEIGLDRGAEFEEL